MRFEGSIKLKKEIRGLFSLGQKEENLKACLSWFMEVVTGIESLNQVEAVQAFYNSINNRKVGAELKKSSFTMLGDLQRIVNCYVQVEESVTPWNNKFLDKGINKRNETLRLLRIKKFKSAQPTYKSYPLGFTSLMVQ